LKKPQGNHWGLILKISAQLPYRQKTRLTLTTSVRHLSAAILKTPSMKDYHEMILLPDWFIQSA
jgi:hypothetical protein